MSVPLSEEELEKILRQFDRLSALLVDTSSLIQIEKAGFLSLLSGKVQLFTLPQVREEYLRGDPSLPFPQDVRILSSPTPTGMAPQGTANAALNDILRGTSLLFTSKTIRRPASGGPSTDSTAPTNEAIHEAFYTDPTTAPTDEVLLAVARTRRLSLLSEDRKLLLKADGLGLEYYNALMMLEFLQYRKAFEPAKEPSTTYQPVDSPIQKQSFDISPAYNGLYSLAGYPPFDYSSLKQRLLAQSRYSSAVRRFAEQLHFFIEKVGG